MPETAPRKQPRQARARNLVTRILEAAKSLYAREGLAACNTNRIAREARISVGSLYQYFPTRDAVLAELWRAQELQLAEQIRACPHDNLGVWLEALIAVFIEHKSFAHREHAASIVESAIRESFRHFEGDVPSGLAPDIAGDLRAIIVALLERETQDLAGWEYTLTQRSRRTLAGYLAMR